MFLEQEQQEHKFRFKNTNSEIKKKKKLPWKILPPKSKVSQCKNFTNFKSKLRLEVLRGQARRGDLSTGSPWPRWSGGAQRKEAPVDEEDGREAEPLDLPRPRRVHRDLLREGLLLHHAIQSALSRIGGAEELTVDVESACIDSVPKVAARLRSVFGVERR